MPEQQVLDGALTGWIDHLRKEATRKASSHPLWQHVHKASTPGSPTRSRGASTNRSSGFEIGLTDEVDRTARAIYIDLEKNPRRPEHFPRHASSPWRSRGSCRVRRPPFFTAARSACLLIPLVGLGGADAGRILRQAVRRFPSGADAQPAASAGDAASLRAARRLAHAMADHRRLGARTAATILQRLPENLQQLRDAVEA